MHIIMCIWYCLFMKINSTDNEKILKLCNDLTDASNEINEDLNKISQLIELLPITFNDLNTKKICEIMNNENIVKLKNYCLKISYMSIFLQKIDFSYRNLDEKFQQQLNR